MTLRKKNICAVGWTDCNITYLVIYLFFLPDSNVFSKKTKHNTTHQQKQLPPNPVCQVLFVYLKSQKNDKC